jgi:hypothetical protein
LAGSTGASTEGVSKSFHQSAPVLRDCSHLPLGGAVAAGSRVLREGGCPAENLPHEPRIVGPNNPLHLFRCGSLLSKVVQSAAHGVTFARSAIHPIRLA